jgi:hypothetical protein
MNEYVVEFGSPGDRVFSLTGDSGILAKNADETLVFQSSHTAKDHIGDVLHSYQIELNDPVENHVVPVLECTIPEDEWSIEDILRNAG